MILVAWKNLNQEKHYLTYSNIDNAVRAYEALKHRKRNGEDIAEVFFASVVRSANKKIDSIYA